VNSPVTSTLPRHDIADASLAAEGRKRIEWAERNMPVLAQIRERFEKSQPFAGVRISACMHVTTETANLMRVLKAGGAEIALCASNPLSTQDDTAAALVHEYGISVFARNAVDRDGYYSHINAALDIEPHQVFDDGCDLVNTLHTTRKELLPNIAGGCEETTTGVLRLNEMAAKGTLMFRAINVNDSVTKSKFDNLYGCRESLVDSIKRATDVMIAGKVALVAGYGDVGKGSAQALRALSAQVWVTEIDPINALQAAMEGYKVVTMEYAADKADIFVSATGNKNVIRYEHMAAMKDEAIVCNIGHFDNEIDVVSLEKLHWDEIKPQVDHITFPDGKKITLLAKGRLVNLGCATGHPSFVMSSSFANQTIAQIELFTRPDHYESGKVYVLPKHLDEKVARLHLKKVGAMLTELTDEQAAYIGVSKTGPYKADTYRY